MRLLAILALCSSLMAQVSVKGPISLKGPVSVSPSVPNDFASRSAGVNVPGGSASIIRAIDFDTDNITRGVTAAGDPPHFYPLYQTTDYSRVGIDTSIKKSGTGSLVFTVPGLTNTTNSYVLNWNDADFSNHVGPGGEFYVQYSIREENFNHVFVGGGGEKNVLISEGDRVSYIASSCSDQEIVTDDVNQIDTFQVYHSCGSKDTHYEGLFGNRLSTTNGTSVRQNAVLGACTGGSHPEPPCLKYKDSTWQTVQIHVKVGTPYLNDLVYHKDSTVEMWVADEGQPSKLVMSYTDYDLVVPVGSKYGKLWLTPSNNGKVNTEDHPTAKMWFDDLIISKRRLPDPDVAVPNAPDSLTVTAVTANSISLSWRDNASDETGYKIERCTGNDQTCYESGTWTEIESSLPANTQTYTGGGLTSATYYTFRVRAYNAAGNSAYTGATCWWASTQCYGTARTN